MSAPLLNPDDIEIVAGCAAAHPAQRGGQHVARACSGVLAIHKPTGVCFRATTERSQIKNREAALKMLRYLVGHFKAELVGDPTRDRCCLVCGCFLLANQPTCVTGHYAPENLAQ